MQLTEPDFSRRLNVSLRARVTLIVVITPEEERVVSQIREVCERWDPPRQCIAWDSVDGFSIIVGNKDFLNQSRDPLTARRHSEDRGGCRHHPQRLSRVLEQPAGEKTDPQLLAGIPLQPAHDRDRDPDTQGTG